jgi:predicted transcriptional regulator
VARPKSAHPTRGELEVLKVLWQREPCTVREIWEVLNRQRKRHYTSVASLLKAMAEKGLLTYQAQGRSFIYRANVARERTLGRMVEDLVGRAFAGSASALVLHVLDQCDPSPAEMDEIARILRQHRKAKGGK